MASDIEEKRADTVALPRSTWKAITFVAGIAFLGISSFIWTIGIELDELKSDVRILELRVKHLEDFGPGKGKRFTERDGIRLEGQIDQVRQQCEKHRELGAHREQAQLNREFKWRLKNLEKPNSDGPIHFKLGPNE